MIFIVNNDTDIDITFYVNETAHFVKANDRNIAFEARTGQNLLSVKRVNRVQLPDYKKMLWSEILGGISSLFMKTPSYIFDVSSEYSLELFGDETVSVNIIRQINSSNPDGVYDMICMESSCLNLRHIKYCVENKKDISQMYGKCRRVAHFWMYFMLEALFTIVGLVITYPILFALYLSTKAILLMVIILAVPILLIGGIALIGVLPLHLLFKFQDKGFYSSMENREICSYMKKQ